MSDFKKNQILSFLFLGITFLDNALKIFKLLQVNKFFNTINIQQDEKIAAEFSIFELAPLVLIFKQKQNTSR